MPHKEIEIITIWPIAIFMTPIIKSIIRAKSRSKIRLKTIRLAMKT